MNELQKTPPIKVRYCLAAAGRSVEIFRPDNEIQDRNFVYQVSNIRASVRLACAFLLPGNVLLSQGE
ncbi:hypothetical protein, partial [Shouchella shacheensis]|uniref:hypothetical protein n=1 Tax=Shouchella shacheensis TaxID=1649580 RepID=UPI000B1F625B